MNNYKIQGHIGEGAHGYVMKGVNMITNQQVALKKLILKSNMTGIPNNVLREIKTLQQLDCDYVVQLIDVIPQGLSFVLVMEYLPSSLYYILADWQEILTMAIIKMYMYMLLKGLSYLHGISIMHRDIKPANLLIAKNGTLKIADFGLARVYSENERQFSHQAATRWYRAPELLYGSCTYTPAVDMWAAGCIFIEMINKSPLFPGETDIEQLALVLRTLGTPKEEKWPGLKLLPDYKKISFPDYEPVPWEDIMPEADSETIHFAKKFLRYHDAARITADQALMDFYFMMQPLPASLEDMPKPREVKINEVDNLISSKFEYDFGDLNNLIRHYKTNPHPK